MKKPVLLEISRVGNNYRFRLEQPELGATVRQFVSGHISKANQQSLRQAMEQAALNPSGPFSLESLGQLMWSLVLPSEIQTFLQQLKHPLLVSTDAPEIPWELFYNEENQQFLGLQCAMGRRLVTETAVPTYQEETTTAPPSFLLIGNPQGDLVGAENEIEQVADLITKHGFATRTLTGGRASWFSVQLELQKREENYVGIHYAGHATYDKTAKQDVLLLADRTKLTADSIRQLLQNRPIIFLNACGTDKPSIQGKRPTLPWQITEGLAAAFIHGGARCVIGTRWEVDDLKAAEFAILFYNAAFHGAPLGDSLRQARIQFRAAYPNDVTWAAFVLYGDPSLLLVKTSHLFSSNNQLNPAAFAPTLHPFLAQLPIEAQLSGYDAINTAHLFMALTQLEGSLTQNILHQMGYSPQIVHDDLCRNIKQAPPKTLALPVTQTSFSPQARSILLSAEEKAQDEDPKYIDEKHVLLVFLQKVSGITLESLRKQGVDVQKMQAILRGEPPIEPDGAVAVLPPSTKKLPPDGVAFTPEATQVFIFALQEACRMGHKLIETPHFVIGLTKIKGGSMALALQQQGFNPKQVRDTIRYALSPVGPARPDPAAFRPDLFAPRVQTIVSLATAAAHKQGHHMVSESHLLVAFLQVQESSTAEFLRSLNIDLDQMATVAQNVQQGVTPPSPTPLLNKLGRDLTKQAQEGKLKPVVGRRQEISRIAQVLARSDKNTPLLVGEAGVGKTAVVEGLAQRIAEGKVPAHLKGKRLIELPIAGLVAGTKYRGDMEERLSQLIQEASQPDVILFLDEIHTLVGAGRAEGGALDVSNILKPALARGEIRCIGATTTQEFQHTIEKDTALERRFQRIVVEEPSATETIEMLRQTRHRYEAYHKVQVSDEAIETAVQLAITYLPDRRLPDKACDLLEEACVRAWVPSVTQWSSPTPATPDPPLITANIIAKVLAEWTGIPLARLTEAEQEKLLNLENLLQKQVIGQDNAIQAVAQAIRLGRAGLKHQNRPIGVFLFIGPTGTGKTHLAKKLAETLFGSEQSLIRFDMSEFMEAHSTAKLLGAPPGYVGYEGEGQLTGPLRRKRYAVVLLDEIEKAHSRIFDLFLQLFDDGRITDAQGRLVDGKNAIFIMTSNIATELVEKRRPMGFPAQDLLPEDPKPKITAELRQTFRPEFLNRLDDIVLFNRLTPHHIRQIARLQLDQLTAHLQAQHGLTLTIEESALDLICTAGYNEAYGARPLERMIEQQVAQPLSEKILLGDLQPVRLINQSGKIVLQTIPADIYQTL